MVNWAFFHTVKLPDASIERNEGDEVGVTAGLSRGLSFLGGAFVLCFDFFVFFERFSPILRIQGLCLLVKFGDVGVSCHKIRIL